MVTNYIIGMRKIGIRKGMRKLLLNSNSTAHPHAIQLKFNYPHTVELELSLSPHSTTVQQLNRTSFACEKLNSTSTEHELSSLVEKPIYFLFGRPSAKIVVT